MKRVCVLGSVECVSFSLTAQKLRQTVFRPSKVVQPIATNVQTCARAVGDSLALEKFRPDALLF